jgi:membrane protein
MTIWKRFRRLLHQIWETILIPYNLVFNRGPIGAYRRAHGGDVAATIAFNALFSLVPLLLLLVAIAGRFLQNDKRLESAINQVSQFLPEGQSREAIDTLLTAREQSTTIGIISLVGLVWIGTSFVTTLARAMDRIYRVPERNFFNNRIRALAVVLVFGLLLFASVIFAAVPTYFANEGVPDWIRDHVPSGYISLVISYGVSVFSGVMLFGILHFFLPNTDQGVLDIWPGVIAAAISFTALTQAFPIYLQLTTNLSTYGAVFGVIWLLLTWFLAIAHILVISTLINAWNFRRRRRREFERNLARRASHV